MGLEIRNEKVTPMGRPALVKPMNRGIDEQAQNGVMVPMRAPTMFAHMPWRWPRSFLCALRREVALDVADDEDNRHE